MRLRTFVLSSLLCFSLTAFGSQPATSQPGDVFVFLNAVALSYNGYHAQAREEFEKYHDNHPDDLLAPVRMLYDRTSEVHFKDMDPATYKQLLDEVNAAIGVYETKGCAGTDLAGVTENTIDCDYIAAALYSFRVAILAGNEGYVWKFKNRKALRADDDTFFDHARRSKSLQALFLLGVHENELSKSVLGAVTKDPRDHQEALETIKRSLADGSPFADDIWFYVLKQQIQNPSDAQFFPETPVSVIVERLKYKHPNQKYPPFKEKN